MSDAVLRYVPVSTPGGYYHGQISKNIAQRFCSMIWGK